MPTRATEGVTREKLLGEKFRLVALERIADNERAAPGVVADDRLEMAAVDADRRQRERDARVSQCDGAGPIGAELAHDPSVGFCPVAFLVVEGAAVTDLLRDGRRGRQDGPRNG